MRYHPEPIPTQHISLSQELMDLVEILAKNSHEVWAKKRMSEGWKYGSQRNDAKKEHPNLVPYEELPVAEKEYDRELVRQQIKSLLTLGFQVKKIP